MQRLLDPNVKKKTVIELLTNEDLHALDRLDAFRAMVQTNPAYPLLCLDEELLPVFSAYSTFCAKYPTNEDILANGAEMALENAYDSRYSHRPHLIRLERYR